MVWARQGNRAMKKARKRKTEGMREDRTVSIIRIQSWRVWCGWKDERKTERERETERGERSRKKRTIIVTMVLVSLHGFIRGGTRNALMGERGLVVGLLVIIVVLSLV